MSFRPPGPRNTISRVGLAATSAPAELGVAAPAPARTRTRALASSARKPASSDAAAAARSEQSQPPQRLTPRNEPVRMILGDLLRQVPLQLRHDPTSPDHHRDPTPSGLAQPAVLSRATAESRDRIVELAAHPRGPDRRGGDLTGPIGRHRRTRRSTRRRAHRNSGRGRRGALSGRARKEHHGRPQLHRIDPAEDVLRAPAVELDENARTPSAAAPGPGARYRRASSSEEIAYRLDVSLSPSPASCGKNHIQ